MKQVNIIKMKLVYQTPIGKPLMFDGAVPTNQVQLLKNAFGITNIRITETQEQEVHRLLNNIHANERWLACDCHGDTTNPALLCVVKTGQRLTIRRMPDEKRPLHTQKCVFRFDRKEIEDEVEAKVTSEKPLGSMPNLLLYTAYTDELPQKSNLKSQQAATQNNTERRPRLASVLFHLLSLAGLDSIGANDAVLGGEATTRCRSKIRAAVADQFLDGRTRKLSLRDYWIDFPEDIQNLKAKLQRADPLRWPKNKRKTGYLMLIADDVAGSHIIVKKGGQSLPVEVDLTCLARANSVERPPYIVLCAITSLPNEPDNFKITHAYAHPVYSHNLWIPVDSDYEREVLRNLISLQGWFNKSRNVQVRIQKPLQNIEVDLDYGQTTQCRPDFLLQVDATKKQAVIEVMGFNTAEYLAKKQITLPRMRRLGEVFEIKAFMRAEGHSMDEIMKAVKPRLIASLLSTVHD